MTGRIEIVIDTSHHAFRGRALEPEVATILRRATAYLRQVDEESHVRLFDLNGNRVGTLSLYPEGR